MPRAMLARPPGGGASATTSSTEGWARELKKVLLSTYMALASGREDQDLLKSCGLWVKEVEGDGACLFRASLGD